MAKKNIQKTTDVVDAAPAETEVKVETIEETDVRKAFDEIQPIPAEPIQKETVRAPVVRDDVVATEEPVTDLNTLLSSACSAASAVMDSLNWNSTSALTDAQIQQLIDPFLAFAGPVPVETAGPLVVETTEPNNSAQPEQ